MGHCAPALKCVRHCLLALFACLTVLVTGAGARAESNSLEYSVKATYLYKFAPFVEWPDAAFPSSSSAIGLCVVGDDPFGAILDRAVRGQRVGQRPIEIRRPPTARPDSGCHIMYVAGSDAQSIAEALDAVRGTPVLTVTDAERDPRAKGVIHFVIQDNRVRFEIGDYAASANRLKISSKLLSLAVLIRSGQ